MQLPDLESLRCFVAAAERLNFAAAAGAVAISPQAFSGRIANLEQALGAQLFQRTTRKVTLTAAGHRLLPSAKRLLADAGVLPMLVAEDGAHRQVRLKVGTRFELGMSYLLPNLLKLEHAQPGRTLDVVFGDSPDLMRSLRDGRVDCVITSLRLTMPHIAYATLHREDYTFVGAPELLGTAPLACAADARKHVLLDTLPSLPLFRYFLDAAPGDAAWSFARTRHLGAIAAVRHLAVAGAGVGVLPAYFVAEDMARGALQPVMPEVVLNHDFFRLIWNDGHVLADEFVALARDLAHHPLQ